MSWNLSKRYHHLRKILALNGALWRGSDSEFIEYIHRSIPYLDYYLRDTADQYYIKGNSRPRNENGLFTKDSALFYQYLRTIRSCFSHSIKMVNGDAKLALSLLKESKLS